jgi:hypothetical protein
MPATRKTDPVTSHAAAASVENLTVTQKFIVQFLKAYGPMSDERLADTWFAECRIGSAPYVSDSGLRSRRAELVAKGLVVDSGVRVKMRSGRQAIVWAAA